VYVNGDAVILCVICPAAAASSSHTTSVSMSTSSHTTQPAKEPPESHPELTFSYELQQGYRILRELTGDSNKSFVGPFLNPIDSSSPDYAEYHKRVKRPIWLKQSKLKLSDSRFAAESVEVLPEQKLKKLTRG